MKIEKKRKSCVYAENDYHQQIEEKKKEEEEFYLPLRF